MASSYDAFISYSHAADGKLAPALQTALQRFAKPWYRLRALHLFRDQTSLSATPGLWPAIEAGADRDSRYFLLLASPEAAQSRWVQQEVAWWLEHKSPQTLLIALTDGKIVRQPGAKDFDWSEADHALPPTLQGGLHREPALGRLPLGQGPGAPVDQEPGVPERAGRAGGAAAQHPEGRPHRGGRPPASAGAAPGPGRPWSSSSSSSRQSPLPSSLAVSRLRRRPNGTMP